MCHIDSDNKSGNPETPKSPIMPLNYIGRKRVQYGTLAKRLGILALMGAALFLPGDLVQGFFQDDRSNAKIADSATDGVLGIPQAKSGIAGIEACLYQKQCADPKDVQALREMEQQGIVPGLLLTIPENEDGSPKLTDPLPEKTNVLSIADMQDRFWFGKTLGTYDEGSQVPVRWKVDFKRDGQVVQRYFVVDRTYYSENGSKQTLIKDPWYKQNPTSSSDSLSK